MPYNMSSQLVSIDKVKNQDHLDGKWSTGQGEQFCFFAPEALCAHENNRGCRCKKSKWPPVSNGCFLSKTFLPQDLGLVSAQDELDFFGDL